MRKNYELPCPISHFEGDELIETAIFLPDYVTIKWFSPVVNDICEAQVHPSRLEFFLNERIELEGEGVIFYG